MSEYSIQELYRLPKNYTALVTGGGTGIGLYITRALAANGAKVYITGRREEVLEKSASEFEGNIIPLKGDIASKDSIEALYQEVASKEKHLNLLVNNAGIAGPTVAFEKAEEGPEALKKEIWSKSSFEDWGDVYQTNVTGHFFTSIAFLPLLAAATEQQQGESACILDIGSISGMVLSTQHHPQYNASKAASNHIAKSLAFELQKLKIRSNGIAPGIFPSEMTAGESDEKNQSHIPADGFREDKGIPAGRPGKGTEMALAALHIARNNYVNGQVFAIDGGYTVAHPTA